jgi:hypothetical protein
VSASRADIRASFSSNGPAFGRRHKANQDLVCWHDRLASASGGRPRNA